MDSSSSYADFSFGFNSDQFSDKTLRIVFLPDDHPKPSPTSRKRDRDEQLQNSQELSLLHKKQTRDSSMLGLDGTPISEKNQDQEAVTEILSKNMDMNNQSGDEVSQKDESSREAKFVPVCSLLLAGHSPFFHKLFSNGMSESGQQYVTIHIQASEEAAFMDLLQYMYTRSLSRTTPSALLDVLVIADRFDVASCVKLSSQMLLNLPMTLELASLYLDQASFGLLIGPVKPLLDAAGHFLLKHFGNLSKRTEFWQELRKLPLLGVKIVLSSGKLVIDSEDDIYDFMFQWVILHYPAEQSDERRKILNMLVRRHLRYPFLTTEKLASLQTCEYIDSATASKLLVDSLQYYKGQLPAGKHSDDILRKPRIYKNLHLKAIVYDDNRQECVVYLDLKKDVCARLFPSVKIHSETFYLGKHGLVLFASCSEGRTSHHSFGLSIHSETQVPVVGLHLTLKIESWEVANMAYTPKLKEEVILLGGDCVDWHNVVDVQWSRFILNTSRYVFSNGILRLRCTIKVEN